MCSDKPRVPASKGKTKIATNARIFPPREAESDGRNTISAASTTATTITAIRSVVAFILIPRTETQKSPGGSFLECSYMRHQSFARGGTKRLLVAGHFTLPFGDDVVEVGVRHALNFGGPQRLQLEFLASRCGSRAISAVTTRAFRFVGRCRIGRSRRSGSAAADEHNSGDASDCENRQNLLSGIDSSSHGLQPFLSIISKKRAPPSTLLCRNRLEARYTADVPDRTERWRIALCSRCTGIRQSNRRSDAT